MGYRISSLRPFCLQDIPDDKTFLCIFPFDCRVHPGWFTQHRLCKGNCLLLSSEDLCVLNVGKHVRMCVCVRTCKECGITSLFCSSFILSSDTCQVYLCCNLFAFSWELCHSSHLWSFKPVHSYTIAFASYLHAFHSADVLTDWVIAPEADAWTQDDIALDHELMLKLRRISGIHPYSSYLIIQGGGETCLRT